MPHLSRRAASLLGLAALVSPRAFAQSAYPSRPIRLIIGFPPGAASDICGRIFAEYAAPVLGQQFVPENKPGAGSSIAGQYVTRAAPDGHTLFVPALSSLTNELANPKPAFDMSKDFAAVALLASLTIVLVVNPATGVRSISDLVAYAKRNPGKVLYASVGAGSLPHLCGVMFAQRAGVELVHIPYPGSPQGVMDVVAGRITMMFGPASGIIGQVAAGKLVALATAADKRPAALPDVPTMAEAGMADFDTSLWLGLLAPAGTPRPILDKLADAARKAMHAPVAVETLRKQGYEPLDAGPDEFAAFIRSEITRWSLVARGATKDQ
ncbi:MAG: tripartite tricarboxylate transporter substrate binding protein [Alphaproteobacteria bacterium]|nr:tripartite tricarboxylate transporter substrate binding protein [Alphaproteobacteria bacterium]